jgi:hypothetical protein
MSEMQREFTARRIAEPVIRKYEVTGSGEWASIVVTDEGPGRGQVMINSTFGNWSYYWGAMGTDCIRSFLVGCDNGYLQSKLMSGRREVSGVFDEVATVKAIKEHIRDHLSGDAADEELELLEDTEFDDEVARHHWVDETKIEEPWFFFQTKPEPQSRCFLSTLWPVVVALWKQELQSEARAA